MKLVEGLKAGDLEDLVLPLVNIDEYESKLDDDSIVIAFYVMDREPASDLNRFIQKGATNILDTDLSPAPNEDGYYLVFVEMLRDQNFPKKLESILESLHGLTNIKSWKAQIHDIDGTHVITPELLSTQVRLVPIDDGQGPEKEDDLEESVKQFFKDSILESVTLEGRALTLGGRFSDVNFTLVDFDTLENVQENNAVMQQGYRLDEAAQHNVSRVQALLGDHWLVEHLAEHIVISNYASSNVALLRL
jgi:hypothetical protein